MLHYNEPSKRRIKKIREYYTTQILSLFEKIVSNSTRVGLARTAHNVQGKPPRLGTRSNRMDEEDDAPDGLEDRVRQLPSTALAGFLFLAQGVAEGHHLQPVLVAQDVAEEGACRRGLKASER
jgi:hypothetical protein